MLPQDETWTDFDGPSWIQYDLFRKNKLPGSKKVNLAKFMLRARMLVELLRLRRIEILALLLVIGPALVVKNKIDLEVSSIIKHVPGYA